MATDGEGPEGPPSATGCARSPRKSESRDGRDARASGFETGIGAQLGFRQSPRTIGGARGSRDRESRGDGCDARVSGSETGIGAQLGSRSSPRTLQSGQAPRATVGAPGRPSARAPEPSCVSGGPEVGASRGSPHPHQVPRGAAAERRRLGRWWESRGAGARSVLPRAGEQGTRLALRPNRAGPTRSKGHAPPSNPACAGAGA